MTNHRRNYRPLRRLFLVTVAGAFVCSMIVLRVWLAQVAQ